jgi:pimeloyl-ACP methyl ester carboxylesterase
MSRIPRLSWVWVSWAWVPTAPGIGGHARSRRVGFVVVSSLAYDDRGTGEPVVFIAGQGGAGRTWHLHQVPAFLAAGYRVITFDNRGVGATENAEGFTTQTMVADTAELIESLGAAPARIVGVSMGAFIAQELMVSRPELVSKAVLMATRGRLDRVRKFFRTAESELAAEKTRIPASYDAKIRLLESFSPKTLNNDAAVEDWIAMFTMWPVRLTPGSCCQLDVAPQDSRLPAYRNITAPVLVIGFADDVMTPPHLCCEVADAIPHGRYLEICDAGHLGFLERPQEVNAAALQFLR